MQQSDIKKKLSDVLFIKEYDSEIGALYEEAKASYIDAPIQTLVTLRSILHKICYDLYVEHCLKGVKRDELALLIRALSEHHIINTDAIKLIRDIKSSGDKAAHKHQSNYSMEQYREMARDSVRYFCDLIEVFNQSFLSVFSGYYFESKVASYLKELTYKALIDNDADAKYKVGVALMEKIITTWNSDITTQSPIENDNGNIGRGIKLIKEAADHRHKDAMFEYAMLLLSGDYIPHDLDGTMKYLLHAADLGHIEAKAYFGCIALEKNFTDDISLAIRFLNESAEKLNPFALAKLGELYGKGEHVEFDLEKSIDLLEQAAEQEFALAYYLLAENKWASCDFDSCKDLLHKSKNLGHANAALLLARLYSSFFGNKRKALIEYDYYLDTLHLEKDRPFCLEIIFEKELLEYSLKGDDFESLKAHLLLLTGYSMNEFCSDNLLTKIYSVTPSLIDKYQQLLISNNNESEEDRLLIKYFPNNKAVKIRDEISNTIHQTQEQNKLKKAQELKINTTLAMQKAKKMRRDANKKKKKNKNK